MTVALLVLSVALAAGPQAAGAELEREARGIEAMLIAPCCFSQQVSVHHSPAADEIRRDVRARLAAGQTRQQIVDAYVGRYGKRILAEPPASGFDLTLYAAPLVILLVNIGLVVFVVRRFVAGSTAAVPRDVMALPHPISAADEARLDEELRDLD